MSLMLILRFFWRRREFDKLVAKKRAFFEYMGARGAKNLKKFEKELKKGRINSFAFGKINGSIFDKLKFKKFSGMHPTKDMKTVQISVVERGSQMDTAPYLKF